MPIITKKTTGPASDSELRGRLTAEWLGKDAIDPHPTIIQEEDDTGAVVHVYVVWDDWKNLGQEERSAIITDAYWEVFAEKGLALTVAMGLLPDEARRLNLID